MDMGFSEKLFSTFCGKKLFCGYSGGADSTAALLLVLKFREKFGLYPVAVHINHHLRGDESDMEAVEAEKFAAERGVEFRRFDIHLQPGGNLEARAREARLRIWRQLCAENPGSAVVLGHHADDRMENLLLRLGRGSNVSGLTGLRMFSMVGEVTFIRPLYNWRRSRIEEFLRSENIEKWAMDSSNERFDAARNVLRNRIVPELLDVLPSGADGFLRSLEMLESDAAFLEDMAAKKLAGGNARDTGFWRDVPAALLPRMLRRFAAELFGVDRVFSGAAVARFAAAVEKNANGIVTLGYGEDLKIIDGKISVPERECELESVVWDWQQEEEKSFGKFIFRAEITGNREFTADGEKVAYFDALSLPEQLILSLPLPGEEMIPFGRKDKVKLKKLRVDRKVAASEKRPVLKSCAGEVLWYPGIRRGTAFPAAEKGKMVRFSCFKPEIEEKR